MKDMPGILLDTSGLLGSSGLSGLSVRASIAGSHLEMGLSLENGMVGLGAAVKEVVA